MSASKIHDLYLRGDRKVKEQVLTHLRFKHDPSTMTDTNDVLLDA